MTNFYYLLPSLPSLTLHLEQLPIGREDLLGTFESVLSEKQWRVIESMSLQPNLSIVGDAICDGYNQFERGIRNALVHGLAPVLGVSEENNIQEGDTLLLGTEIGQEALTKANPLERQRFLAIERWNFLQNNWSSSGFTFVDVQLYYLRWLVLNELVCYVQEAGEQAFDNYYQKVFAGLGSLELS